MQPGSVTVGTRPGVFRCFIANLRTVAPCLGSRPSILRRRRCDSENKPHIVGRVQLSGLFVYPIKACGGIALEQADVVERGLAFDRRYMLVDPSGTFVTQREVPQLCRVSDRVAARAAAGLGARHGPAGAATATGGRFAARAKGVSRVGQRRQRARAPRRQSLVLRAVERRSDPAVHARLGAARRQPEPRAPRRDRELRRRLPALADVRSVAGRLESAAE